MSSLTKVGYVLYFQAHINDDLQKVFINEYDSIEDAEVKKSEINRGPGNIDVVTGVATHHIMSNGEDHIVIKPRDGSNSFLYTDMVCVNDVARVCDEVIGVRG